MRNDTLLKTNPKAKHELTWNDSLRVRRRIKFLNETTLGYKFVKNTRLDCFWLGCIKISNFSRAKRRQYEFSSWSNLLVVFKGSCPLSNKCSTNTDCWGFSSIQALRCSLIIMFSNFLTRFLNIYRFTFSTGEAINATLIGIRNWVINPTKYTFYNVLYFPYFTTLNPQILPFLVALFQKWCYLHALLLTSAEYLLWWWCRIPKPGMNLFISGNRKYHHISWWEPIKKYWKFSKFHKKPRFWYSALLFIVLVVLLSFVSRHPEFNQRTIQYLK